MTFTACKSKGKATTPAAVVEEPAPAAVEEPPPPPPPPPPWSSNADVIAACERQPGPETKAECLAAADAYTADPLPVMNRCAEKPFNILKVELACIKAGAKLGDAGLDTINTCVTDNPNKNNTKARDKAIKCVEAAAATAAPVDAP